MEDEILRPGQDTLAVVDVSSLKSHKDVALFEYTDRLGATCQGFILRWHNTLVAYEDRCPHWHVPLLNDGEVFAPQGLEAYITCALHGAIFEPDTGECISGPCMGDALTRLEIDMDGDEARLRFPPRRLFNTLKI